jgi:hypothetical protein
MMPSATTLTAEEVMVHMFFSGRAGMAAWSYRFDDAWAGETPASAHHQN